MRRRLALSIALGTAGASALIALYLVIVTWAQGLSHAIELLWDDPLLVGLVSAGFGTQIGVFTYVRLLQRDLARGPVALAGAGTATSSVAMIACCAHHLIDVLPIVGLSGLAVFLVEFRTPLVLLGLATNALGIAVMIRELWRVASSVRVISRHAARPDVGAGLMTSDDRVLAR